jgi:hypothetical protein
VRRADNLTTFMCRLSRNLGASTSWSPKGLSRPVMGLLYLYKAYLGRPTFNLSVNGKYMYMSIIQLLTEVQYY